MVRYLTLLVVAGCGSAAVVPVVRDARDPPAVAMAEPPVTPPAPVPVPMADRVVTYPEQCETSRARIVELQGELEVEVTRRKGLGCVTSTSRTVRVHRDGSRTYAVAPTPAIDCHGKFADTPHTAHELVLEDSVSWYRTWIRENCE